MFFRKSQKLLRRIAIHQPARKDEAANLKIRIPLIHHQGMNMNMNMNSSSNNNKSNKLLIQKKEQQKQQLQLQLGKIQLINTPKVKPTIWINNIMKNKMLFHQLK